MTLPASNDLPAVDIIISTYNEEAYIDRCLQQTLGQDYPAELLKIWLVDGGSTDATVATATRWAQMDPRLTIVVPKERLNLPQALNLGLERSSAPIVAKIDAHGYPETNYISQAVALLTSDPTAKCVGGRPVQKGDTRFGEAVAFARGSRVGVGGSEYGGTGTSEYVASVQCGVYTREALRQAGWFDPTMNYGEDDELNWRLTQRGYRILLDTRIRFHYITRPTWRTAFRQYRNYGRARVRVVRKHPRYLRLYHLAPAALVVILTTAAMAAPFAASTRYLFAALLGLYLLTLTIEAIRVCRMRIRLIPCTIAAFAALHVGYGVGILMGVADVISGIFRPRLRFTRSHHGFNGT